LLGIPTVLDRVIQQAIAQVLQKVWDHAFCDSGFGGVSIRCFICSRSDGPTLPSGTLSVRVLRLSVSRQRWRSGQAAQSRLLEAERR